MEEAKALRGELPGAHIKNLFLRNKKGVMWLVTCQEDRDIDLKALGQRIGAGRLSFGSAERLMTHLGVLPGSVTPFAVINDRRDHVTVVLDSGLLDQDPVNCHPLVNTMTTAIRAAIWCGSSKPRGTRRSCSISSPIESRRLIRTE